MFEVFEINKGRTKEEKRNISTFECGQGQPKQGGKNDDFNK